MLDIYSLRLTKAELRAALSPDMSEIAEAQLGKALWGYYEHLEGSIVLPFGAGRRSAETMLVLEEQLEELREALEQANIKRPAEDTLPTPDDIRGVRTRTAVEKES